MNRFVLFLHVIILSYAYCYASNDNKTDSINVRYEVCGSDTVFYKEISLDNKITVCGLKQYEEDYYAMFEKKYNRDVNEQFCNDSNLPQLYMYLVEKILDGYGKERCTKIVKVNSGKFHQISIFIGLDTEGNVYDLSFTYPSSCAEFMTCSDVVRNTKIIIDSTPVPYFREYAELGVKILPPLHIPILINFIEQYLEERGR